MYFLFYDNKNNTLIITDDQSLSSKCELLESGKSCEALVVRVDKVYMNAYKSPAVENHVEHHVNRYIVRDIKHKNRTKNGKMSPEQYKRHVQMRPRGKNHHKYGKTLSNEERKALSVGMKAHIRVYGHPVTGKKRSLEEQRHKIAGLKALTGKWKWAHNPFIHKEIRWMIDTELPKDFKLGRLPSSMPQAYN